MQFTDEDLRRLKEAMNSEGRPFGWSYGYNPAQIRSLLARLEAAEVYAEFRLYFPSGHDGEKEKLEAWRKESGK